MRAHMPGNAGGRHNEQINGIDEISAIRKPVLGDCARRRRRRCGSRGLQRWSVPSRRRLTSPESVHRPVPLLSERKQWGDGELDSPAAIAPRRGAAPTRTGLIGGAPGRERSRAPLPLSPSIPDQLRRPSRRDTDTDISREPTGQRSQR